MRDHAKLEELQRVEDEARRDVVMWARVWGGRKHRKEKVGTTLAELWRAVEAFETAQQAWIDEYDAQVRSEKEEAAAAEQSAAKQEAL